MANIYKPEKENLATLLEWMGDNAKMLIPDLQRDYVWDPNQIILLVDSLLRGWPFGTLLLWEVEAHGPVHIPARPFWKVADRIYPYKESMAVTRNTNLRKGENNLMVLDGQQRLQSIFIAVGDHEAGLIDYDYEWLRFYNGKRRDYRTAKRQQRCPRACLCIDLDAFQRSFDESNGTVTSINYTGGVLQWALVETDSVEPFQSKYRNFPLRSKRGAAGNLIRFSLFWELASRVTPNDDFETLLRKESFGPEGGTLEDWLSDHRVSEVNVKKCRVAVAKLLMNLRILRNSETAYLKLLPFEAVGIEDEVKYNNLVVSIFTRMNNGGQRLTREDITFAWLKRGWDTSKTDGKDAAACFRELRDAAATNYSASFGLDELITGTGLACSMFHRSGEIIKSQDLMDGDLIQSYARWFCEEWQPIKNGVEVTLALLKDRELLYGTHYHSLYSIGLLWAWRTLAGKWESMAPYVAGKTKARHQIDEAMKSSCDRWLLCSSWAQLWSRGASQTAETLLKGLAEQWDYLKKGNSWDNAGNKIIASLYSWVDDLQEKAADHVAELIAENRSEVVSYRPLLWVWHRLEMERWENSKYLMQDPHNQSDGRLEVDHCVSVDVWAKILSKEGFLEGTSEHSERFRKINALGNCTLLHKSLNSSKRNASMDRFLSKVSTFRTMNGKMPLGIEDCLLHPEEFCSEVLIDAIDKRDNAIRNDLEKFVKGTKCRADL